jgi:hypothetical protein
MGVYHYEPSTHTTQVSVGGHPQTVAVLRRATDRPGQGRPSPRLAALVPGGGMTGKGLGDALVAWEPGMGRTNDYDWDGLPVLGYTGDDGTGTLVMRNREGGVVTAEEAVATGILSADGTLREHRRARVASIGLVEGHEEEAWPTSLGERRTRRDSLLVEMEDGSRRVEALYAEVRPEDLAGGLAGLPRNAAIQAVMDRAWGRAREAMGRCVAARFGGLKLANGSEARVYAAELDGDLRMTSYRDGRISLSHSAPIDCGLADLARLVHGSDGWTVDAQAMLAWEVRGHARRGFMLMASEDGGMTILDGPPLSAAVANACHGIGEVGQMAAGASLVGWGPDQVTVSPRAMAVALGDLSLYVSAIASGEPCDASFEDWRRRNGIDYGMEPGPVASVLGR